MHTQTTIEFLGFEGCPNTPILMKRLQEALQSTPIVEVDLMQLNTGDPRLGWGAPTILIDGVDLFHVSPIHGSEVSCRNWGNGLPEVEEIREALRKHQQ